MFTGRLSYDFVIAGGGPAGITCAMTLAKSGATCLLVERCKQPPWKPGEILESKIIRPLSQLGLLEAFLARPYLRSSGTVSTWGGFPIERSSLINPFGSNFFINRQDFEHFLQLQATQQQVQSRRGAAVLHLQQTGVGWTVTIQENSQLANVYCSFFIEATGKGKSFVTPVKRQKYDSLVALMCYPPRNATDSDLRFFVEGVPSGWFYHAPLPHGSSVFAFLTDALCLPQGAPAQRRYFIDNAGKVGIAHLKTLTLENRKQHIISAMSSKKSIVCTDNWAAIGEAAASFDPLTGHGIVAAMEGGMCLAELLLNNERGKAAHLYQNYIDQVFSEYLKRRKMIYAGENRFANEPFWLIQTKGPHDLLV